MAKRLREYEAKAILTEEIARIGEAYEPNLVRTDGPRAAANERDWWYKGNVEKVGSITPRTLAYFRAYKRIAGENKLYAKGLLLDQGRVHMDKYVMRRLEADGYLTFVPALDAYFELTPAGSTLIETGLPITSA